MTICIYCRHVKPHLADNNHSNENSDRSVFKPEYATADQRAAGGSTDEGSYRERFQNQEVRIQPSYYYGIQYLEPFPHISIL